MCLYIRIYEYIYIYIYIYLGHPEVWWAWDVVHLYPCVCIDMWMSKVKICMLGIWESSVAMWPFGVKGLEHFVAHHLPQSPAWLCSKLPS